ncbi:MAG: DUF6544 family protein [Rhodomicrobium sp.]
MEDQVRSLLERIRRCAMPEGDVECAGTWVRQEGEMRFAPGGRWMRFEAEEWFEGSGIDFRWQAWIAMPPFFRTRVVDSFQKGRGVLTARLFGIIPVARSQGPATGLGEALRGISELPWRPFAFRESPCLTWEAAGAGKIRAVFNDGKTQAAAELEVDAEGHVLGGGAPSRPRLVGKSIVDTPWSGTFGEYRTFGRVRVPVAAEAVWHLPEGPFPYWRGRVLEFRLLN